MQLLHFERKCGNIRKTDELLTAVNNFGKQLDKEAVI